MQRESAATEINGFGPPGGVDIGEAGTFWILVVQDLKLVTIEDDTDGDGGKNL